MNPVPLFVLQFVWFVVAWSAIAVLFVAPRLRGYSFEDALSVVTLPQLFRVLGVGLLVPNLSPDMPRDFALPTAAGDSLTALLALVAILALRRRWPQARTAAWACHVVGATDLAIALPHAAAIGAAQFLTAQWYVPVLGVPLMLVSHVAAIRMLMERRGSPGAASNRLSS